MNIVIDFDGTCVTHEFPKIGKDIGAQRVLKKLAEKGHNLILFTMRSNRKDLGDTKDEKILDAQGDFLDEAVNWFKENDIKLWGIQTNPDQHHWTSSPKAYGEVYIDNAALGCPLIFDPSYADRPYVNWNAVELFFQARNIL